MGMQITCENGNAYLFEANADCTSIIGVTKISTTDYDNMKAGRCFQNANGMYMKMTEPSLLTFPDCTEPDLQQDLMHGTRVMRCEWHGTRGMRYALQVSISYLSLCRRWF